MQKSFRVRGDHCFMLGASLLALAASVQSASAQSCPGVDGDTCEIPVTEDDQDVSTNGATHVVNSATGTTIVQTSKDYLLIENQADASIDSINLLPAATGRIFDTIIVNRGAIEGDLILVDGGFYINDGGTISGNLTSLNGDAAFGTANFASGNKTEVFVNRGAPGDTGVAGVLDPGNGLDVYVQSFGSNATYALPAALPTHFEVGGVEALGADTVVTVAASPAKPITDGLVVMGDGNIVNQAEIDPISLIGIGVPDQFVANLPTAAVSYYGMPGVSRVLAIPVFDPATGVQSVTNLIYGSSLTSFTNESVINGDLLLSAASFVNNGELNLTSNGPGTLIGAAADRDFSFVNNGTIEMTFNGPRPTSLTNTAIALVTAIDATAPKAVSIANGADAEIEGGLSFGGIASDFAFTNDGSIEMGINPNGIDSAVDLDIGGLEVALDPALREDVAADSVTVTNGEAGRLLGGIEISAVTKTFAFVNNGSILQDADDDEAEAVNIELNDYTDANGVEDGLDTETASFVNSGTIGGTTELDLEASTVTISNSGTIDRALAPDVTILANGFSGIEAEQETALGATMIFTNSGTIATADYAGTAVALSIEAGDLDTGLPGVENSSGAIGVVNSGTISATGGNFVTPGMFVGLPTDQTSVQFAVGLSAFVDAEGAGSVSITNAADGVISARGSAHVGLPQGVQPQAAQQTGVAIAAGADTVTIVNEGTILGASKFSLTPDGAILVPDTDLNVASFEGVVGGAIDTFASTDDITNAATGVIEGGIALRAGDDVLRNYGSITGDIDFGTGDDSFIQGINASFAGTADGGAGTDRFLIDITGGGTIDDAIYDQLVNFEILGITGTGSISPDAPLPVDTIELTSGDPVEFGADAVIETQGPVAITGTAANDALTVLGTVNGDVDLGDGDNTFSLGGAVNGNVAFGIGDDMLELQPGWSIAGTASGGAGQDILQTPVTGSYEEPTILDLAGFESFEELDITGGGVGTVTGQLAFDSIDVEDGRLIGLAGSTIHGDVRVAPGGTFGSAGQVDGDIDVDGTLSPGSSPGTMTVNGNVTLASGSNTLFEMTPTVSDAIVINGALTIETGTTLTLTGERPLTPGVAYNLITTTDGISGSFTTIDKADTVLGFISQTANALQLLGTFQLRSGANAQVATTNAYLNSLLINGEATTGLRDAVPDLVDADGFASEAALATLHPEAYASASQISVENGLSIASALRSVSYSVRGDAGAFTFAQGFGNWRNFRADATSGVSKADVRSSGFLGGVGYGSDKASVALFVGRVDAGQPIQAIGARNDADGTFFGATAQAGMGGFNLGASVVVDRSTADTSRTLFNGMEAKGHFRLRGTTADIYAGYDAPISGGWTVGPQVGLNYVSVKRGAVAESGGGAFSLNVEKDSASYSFLTADIVLQRKEGTLRPWLSAGLRQRIDHDLGSATASMTGTSASFSVAGARRNRSLANIEAGFSWRITPSLALFARGGGEFGSGNEAQNVDAGFLLRF